MSSITKEKINQAGCTLAGRDSNLSDDEANIILRDFRSIHQHPMSLFRQLIDRKLKKHSGIDALVSQRLKRTPSIVQKLKIQKKMKLSRMQDIGGLRIVVNSINEVDLIRNEIYKAGVHGNFKFILSNEKDYITTPADSGYRSIHMVYKYDKGIPTEKQCRVEVQIRTRLQHSWATAVEVVGTYLNQPLKQGFGGEEYLDIFKSISKLFVGLENKDKNIDYKYVTKIREEIAALKFFEKLESFNLVSKNINKEKGQYVLLKMDFKQATVNVLQYSAARFKEANDEYSKMELDNQDNSSIDVVLVSVRDIKKLQQSYPNYFMDTEDFIKNLKRLFDSAEITKKEKETIASLESENQRELLNKMSSNIFEQTLDVFNKGDK